MLHWVTKRVKIRASNFEQIIITYIITKNVHWLSITNDEQSVICRNIMKNLYNILNTYLPSPPVLSAGRPIKIKRVKFN